MARPLDALESTTLTTLLYPALGEEMARLDSYSYTTDPLGLAYPNSGRAYKWPDGSYTLVWRDASRRWWFIDVTDRFAAQTNKPQYISPDASFLQNVIDEIEEMIAAGAEAAKKAVDLTPYLVGIGVIVFLASRR